MNLSHWKQFLPKSVTVLRKGYSLRAFGSDVAAGVTVAIIALPLAMALAIASGVPPERGLYTAIIAGFLTSLLGGSRVNIGGPTGAFVIIVFSIVERHGYGGLAVATLMAGAILIAMGLLQFGNLIKFIPYPVTTGFTAGIAVVIFSTQIKDFFGLRMDVPSEVFSKWVAYFHNAATWNPSATVIALGSILIIVLSRKFAPRIPGSFVAVLLSAAAVSLLGLDVETIGSRFGGIPSSLPTPSLPDMSLAQARLLIPEAFTIALLCAIESLLCAVVADGMTGYRHRSNCELVGQGIANLGSIFFGGIPATGAIARTTANINSGGATPVAGMVHAVVLLLVLVFLAPLASLIPLASLAAILVIVAWNMSERERFIYLFKAPKSDIAVLLTTFFLTIFIDLTVAVEVGMVLAAFLFMKRMSQVTNFNKLTRDYSNEDEGVSLADRETLARIPSSVTVYEINGPLFFGVVDRMKDMLDSVRKPPAVFILRMRHVTAVDASGIHALSQFQMKCRKTKTTLILSGLHAQPFVAIRNSGLDDDIGEDNLCATFEEATDRALELARTSPHR